MQCGCVMPVLQHIQHWAPVVDQGLTRHFIVKVEDSQFHPLSTLFTPLTPSLQLLAAIDPPFSTDFLNTMLHIMGTVNVEPIKNTPDKKDISLCISEFLTSPFFSTFLIFPSRTAHCVENQAQYGLDKTSQQVLNQLNQLFSAAPKLKIKLSTDVLTNSNGKPKLNASK